ncbi:hypothetical protein NUM3379_35820 [Kineococcus sp. NUM-3379]
MEHVAVVVYGLTALIGLLTASLMWRRRADSPLVRPLVLMLAGVVHWSTPAAVAAGTADPDLEPLLLAAVYPGIGAVVAGTLWYALILSGRRTTLSRRLVLLLVAEPLLVTVAALTDPWHGLLHGANTFAADAQAVRMGPLFWVHTAYSYAVLGAAAWLILQAMLGSVAAHRRRHAIALAAMFVPTLGNVIALSTDLWSRFALDPTTPCLLVSAATWWWVHSYDPDAHLLPVAHRQVLDALGDAVVVLDATGRVLESNPAAAVLLGGATAGRPWREVVDPAVADAVGLGAGTALVPLPGGTVLDVRVQALQPGTGAAGGWVVVARDVTELEALRARLAEQASRDGLTGLHNRRHLDSTLPLLVEGADRTGSALAVAVVDVDHFKAVNDTHGHAVGDEVLRHVASLLAGGVRPEDTVARSGGEEFVLVLAEADGRTAAARVEELRARCAAAPVVTSAGPVRVTFSAGVAQLGRGGSAELALRLADEALYEAKRRGRDRVVLGRPAEAGERRALTGPAAC